MAEGHQKTLEELAGKNRLRALASRTGLDFTSNDFLGLAESPALKDAVRAALDRGVPVGAGGSRLLRGNHPEHEALEQEAAEFFHAEAALYFPTGFAANAALAATLPRAEDLMVHDEMIHASLREGFRGRFAIAGTAHNDVNAIEDLIKHWRGAGGKGQIWIAAETLYSMDGDKAPLSDLVALAKSHDAMLLLDEAHATGIYGPKGRGLAHAYEGQPNVICLHTCGKAMGAMGGLVTLPKPLRDFMINRARSFIYSTAPSPLMAATVRAALKLVAAAEADRGRLQTLMAHLGGLLEQKLKLTPSGSPIQPILLGSDERALAVAGKLQDAGFDIRAIRPPTVPEGTARLRLSVTLHADTAQLDRLVDALAPAMEFGVTRFIVTGTDTGLGKTVFAAALTAALKGVYFKPVQAGLEPETDSQIVARLSGRPVLLESYCLKLAASPHKAAAAEKIRIDPAKLALPKTRAPLIVEGAGGLLVPLNATTLYIDVFKRWKAPLILCARTQLGTINHTLLSLEAIRARKIPLLGIAFIGEANPNSEAIICKLGNAKRLGRLAMVSPLNAKNLAKAFAAGFVLKDFK